MRVDAPPNARKVAALPASASEGDLVVYTGAAGDPTYKYVAGAWEQQPRMGAVNVPSANLRRVGTQANGTSNDYATAYTVADLNTDGMWASGQPTRLTIQTPGRYRIVASAGAASGQPDWQALSKNGAGNYLVIQPMVVNSGGYVTPVVWEGVLAAGDYIEHIVHDTSAVTIGDASNTYRQAYLTATWLGGAGQTVDERGVPAVRATLAAPGTQVVPTGTAAAVALPAETLDTDSMHDTASNTTRLTVKTPGVYRVSAFVQLAASVGGAVTADLRVNGVAGADPSQFGSYINPNDRGFANALVSLAAGDYVEVFVTNSSGGNVTIWRASLDASLVATGKTVTPFARVRSSVDQSIPVGSSGAAILFDTEDADNDGIHDTAANTTRMVCRTAGVYAINAQAYFNNDGGDLTGQRQLRIRKNGATLLDGVDVPAVNIAGSGTTVTCSTIAELAVGDYIEVMAYVVGTGTAHTLVASGGFVFPPHAAMVKIGAPSAPVQSVQVSGTRVTSLPASPVDGQEVFFVADATNGVIWHLRYNAGSSSAYKWEYVGGPDLTALVATTQTTTSASYTDLATVGPSTTVPLAGDYLIRIGCDCFSSASGVYAPMSYTVGATAATDADAAVVQGTSQITVANERVKTGIAAASAITAKYKQGGGGTTTFQNRTISVRPVRVG